MNLLLNIYLERSYSIGTILHIKVCKIFFVQCLGKSAIILIRKRVKYRSSRSQMFFKIGLLKNFAIFKGKHLCWNLFNKVASLKACNFI